MLREKHRAYALGLRVAAPEYTIFDGIHRFIYATMHKCIRGCYESSEPPMNFINHAMFINIGNLFPPLLESPPFKLSGPPLFGIAYGNDLDDPVLSFIIIF